MWRTHRDQHRNNPRPYPSAARPKIFVSPRQAHRNSGGSRARLFAQDPPPNYKRNLFHFQPQTETHPKPECSTPVNTPVTPVQPPTQTPNSFRAPPPLPKVSPSPNFTSRKPSLQIPGAFPHFEEPVAEPNSPNENIPPSPVPAPAPEHIKRDANQERHKRKRESGDELDRLKKSVRREFGKGPLDDDELMLMKQLNSLHMDAVYRTALFNGQQAIKRAAKSTAQRVKDRIERDAKVREAIALEAEAEKKRQRELAEEAERKRVMEEFEKARQEIRRKEREAQRKLATDNLAREKLRRRAEELAEHGRRHERERKQRESHAREEAERLAKEREDEYRRMQETIRRARQLFSDVDEVSALVQRQFDEYEAKWTELKEGRELPPLSFEILPWPVLGLPAYGPSDITLARVEEFVFHPLRSGWEMKSRRDRVRAEILRWHPDKFNAKVLGKVINPDSVSEGAGVVARFLTEIMERETNKEKGC